MYSFAGGPATGTLAGGILGSLTGSIFLSVIAFVLISLGFAVLRIIPKAKRRQA
jgi:hypothetical protein